MARQSVWEFKERERYINLVARRLDGSAVVTLQAVGSSYAHRVGSRTKSLKNEKGI